MASTVFDSTLFRDMFGTPEMREVFSDTAYPAAAAMARSVAGGTKV
jgi:hypothetical protein